MSISPGARLGPYEVTALIGAGGMGEVYRARDSKQNRDVALKVLPDSFANDPDRLARFKREAQVLASLNHPNIATVSDTLAAVLRADLDWARLPSDLPPTVHQLLGRCLQRDPKRRLQHIGDARIEIEDLQNGRIVSAPEPRAPRRWSLAVAAALLSAAVVGPLAWSFKPASRASGPPTSFIIRTPSEAPVAPNSPLALSPDGRQLVYVVGLGANRRLFHQSLDVFDPRALEGAESAESPFFSPGGDAIGFYSSSAGEVRQLRLAGGAAMRLVDSTTIHGASWGEDGTIVFGLDWGQSLRVARRAASETANLTRLDVAAGEGAHLWPQILPGNKAVLFTIWTGTPSWDEARLAVADLETGQHTVVLRGGASGRYAARAVTSSFGVETR